MQFLTFHSKYSPRVSRGFTLIELIVVIAIFTVITSVVLAKYNTYNSSAPFANASEDIVLSLRQAQVYGVGVKRSAGGCVGGNFECPYGVYFSNSSTERSDLIIFADANGNRVYDLGEEVERISWKNTIQLGTICLDSICTFTKSNITFRRPDPSAFINDSISTVETSSVYDLATIALNNTVTGATSVVTISKAGQISID